MVVNIPTGKQVSFGAYKGYSWYPWFWEKWTFASQVQLTPDKIDEIVHNRLTKDIGIAECMRDLPGEGKKAAYAVNTLNTIAQRFGKVATERTAEIMGRSPSWDGVPLFGVIIHAVQREDFDRETRTLLRDVREDWEGIRDNYRAGVRRIHKEFGDSCDALSEKVEFGVKGPREPFKKGIASLKQAVSSYWNSSLQRVHEPMDGYMIDYVPDLASQMERRQNGRGLRKALFTALTLGLDGGLLESITGPAADALTEVGGRAVGVASEVTGANIEQAIGHAFDNIPDLMKHNPLGEEGKGIAKGAAGEAATETLFGRSVHALGSTVNMDTAFNSFVAKHGIDAKQNLLDFMRSVNLEYAAKTGGEALFMGGLYSTADTLQRNYELHKKISLKDIHRTFKVNSLIAALSAGLEPALVETPMRELGKLGKTKLGEEAASAAQAIIDRLPKPITRKKIEKFIDKFEKHAPDMARRDFVQNKASEIVAEAISGKSLTQKQLEDLLKGMEEFLIEAGKYARKIK